LKHYDNISVLKFVHVALFQFCLAYSIVNTWRKIKKIISLPQIRLRNTSRGLEKLLKSVISDSKYRIKKIPGSFTSTVHNLRLSIMTFAAVHM